MGRRPFQVVGFELAKYEAGQKEPIARLSLNDVSSVSELDWLLMESTSRAVEALRTGADEETRWQVISSHERGGKPLGIGEFIVLPDRIHFVGLCSATELDDWGADPEGNAWKFLEELPHS